MSRWRITLFVQVLIALTCLQLVSGCIFVPVGDDRGHGGYYGGHERDRHDGYRR